MDNLTPMMRQYHEIKRRHPDTLLFFRLGDFYEMFYDDAVLASRVLEITLTSRNNDRQGQPIPMCGVPYHAASGYLARLLKKGYKVAVCDQVEDPSAAKGIVRREVTRILTPGTAVEDEILDSREHNFLAALSTQGREELGAAFLDLSTGEFWCAAFSGEDAIYKTLQLLAQFLPSEVVLGDDEASSSLQRRLQSELSGERTVTPQPEWTFNLDYSQRLLLETLGVQTVEGYGLAPDSTAVSAAGALLAYVRKTQKTELRHISSVQVLDPVDFLQMDEATIQNLELVRDSDGSRKWTLLSAIDFTRTAMGARLLKTWLLRPSVQLEEIEQRLDAVEELNDSPALCSSLESSLEQVHDMERLMSRVAMARANARDLVSLRSSLEVLPQLSERLGSFASSLLKPSFDLLEDIRDFLKDALCDEPPAILTEGGMIRQGYDQELDELSKIARSGKDYIAALQGSEQERTGINSLKVKFNKVFGYFIEVTKANLHLVPDDYIRKQTLASSERYVTPELKEYEEKVLGAEERIKTLEQRLFEQVRARVAAEAARITGTAAFLARLDVLRAFAEAAHRNRYERPDLDDSCNLVIRQGRHPVLELREGDPFVPNDLVCNNSSDQLLLLTGPNMGGKSTYLRQNALIVIMAQMGCFVPAGEARIGLVDRIFTRVGASDNLARGRSTFMVEMVETARILNSATPRSFILLDEVGRGTATFDGLSIAWSVAEYLLTESSRKARTLFATHYQELTKLERWFEGARNYCVTVQEAGSDIIFFHRVLPGVANKSYGIEVARLAGLPPEVIARSREILSRLEKKRLNLTGSEPGKSPAESVEIPQHQLFEA